LRVISDILTPGRSLLVFLDEQTSAASLGIPELRAVSWSKLFDDPIPVPRGAQLVALQDGADYILKLPKAEQNLKEWETATEALTLPSLARLVPFQLQELLKELLATLRGWCCRVSRRRRINSDAKICGASNGRHHYRESR
jgi:hypothetical protein